MITANAISMKRSALAVLLCLLVLLASCSGEAEPTQPSQPDVSEVPSVPSGLTLSTVAADFGEGTSAAAVLAWDDVEGEASFELERQNLLSGDTFALVATLGADTTEYRDEEVILGRPYTYRLRAVNAAGASAYSSLDVTPLPPDATALFNGSDLSAWEPEEEGGELWTIEEGALEVLPGDSVGDNDLRTKEVYRDFWLHVEFNVPESPEDADEQARGNSGVYLQGRYEIQVLDSYGRTLEGEDDVGAVYGVSDASTNASLPAGEWQRYDILFSAPRFEAGAKVEDARVSVRLNGTLIQEDVQIPGPTRLGNTEDSEVGPVVLQAHRDRVHYRNVWIQPLEQP